MYRFLLSLELRLSSSSLLARQSREIQTWKLVKGAPWAVVTFSIGMYVVVYGLRNVGLTDELGDVFKWVGDQGLFVATVGSGFAICYPLFDHEQYANGHD